MPGLWCRTRRPQAAPSRMKCWTLMLLPALLIHGTPAAQTDPLQTPECRAALAALQGAEQAASAAGLAEARRRAAHECLGARQDPPPAGRRAEPPLAVPPVLPPTPPLPNLPNARPPRTPAPPVITPRPPPAPAVIGCDASSCLTSDGQRLLRSGPTLIGPQGACSVQAGLLACP